MNGNGYRGSWLQRSWQREAPQPVHQADPAHARIEQGDPTVGGWAGPPILAQDPAPYVYEGMSDWVTQTGGTIEDLEPNEHDFGYGSRNYEDGFTTAYGVNPADVEYARDSAMAHDPGYGTSHWANYDVPPFIDSTERVIGARFEGVPAFELPQLVGGGQRGLNGSAVNNPPLEMYGGRGQRWGWVEQTWIDRKMYDPTRVHDERLILPNVATVEMNQPVPAQAGAYNSPFDSLARIIRDVRQTPTMRRQPPPITQDITDDAQAAADAYESADWVVA